LGALPPVLWRELCPHLAQCALDLHAKCHLDPSSRSATIAMGRKMGDSAPSLCHPFGEGAGSPSNPKSPGLRPTFVPSGILIHPAVWPQETWAENWGLCTMFYIAPCPEHIQSAQTCITQIYLQITPCLHFYRQHCAHRKPAGI